MLQSHLRQDEGVDARLQAAEDEQGADGEAKEVHLDQVDHRDVGIDGRVAQAQTAQVVDGGGADPRQQRSEREARAAPAVATSRGATRCGWRCGLAVVVVRSRVAAVCGIVVICLAALRGRPLGLVSLGWLKGGAGVGGQHLVREVARA